MVPCNWFEDAAKILKAQKDVDMWVHLTLTSEWDSPYQQWGPTLHAEDVPSLVDKNWLFYKTVNEVLSNASYEDIKKEICNQIRIALLSWIDVSHIDSHMWVLLHEETFDAYKEAAELFKIQPFISTPHETYVKWNRFFNCDKKIDKLRGEWFHVFDDCNCNSPYLNDDYQENFARRLSDVKEWTTYFLLHVLPNSLDPNDFTPDMEARIREYNYLMNDDNFSAWLKRHNISSISMKDI
jgi:predicted glycoside hydrolase/deacetylase ChbG (UPF0249 family)